MLAQAPATEKSTGSSNVLHQTINLLALLAKADILIAQVANKESIEGPSSGAGFHRPKGRVTALARADDVS